ncbi:MAG: hypothetical protein Q9196_006468, partial [Gyalolechia fulgens]
DLRTEKSRLQSQIHELQNQNAQLIEDHTRDVLSIKAKETQLVRARSDAESAEAQVGRLGRELERLKREVKRAEEEKGGGRGEERGYNPGQGIYHDKNGDGKVAGDDTDRPPAYNHRVGSSASLQDAGSRSARSYISSPSEEKENGVLGPGGGGGGEEKAAMPKSRNRSPVKAGPQPQARRDISGEAGESWKRAAEVTTQLKARIEMMKAKQGLNKR